MNVFEYTNPAIVIQTLTESFISMGEEEYRKTLQSTLNRARKFAKSDDSAFSASLEETEATSYADLVRTFLKNLQFLEQISNTPQRVTAGPHAQVIAWWQAISTFKTMHGHIPTT